MNKIVVIHQPDFLPYLGFFHRFLHSDEWVVLDHVQFMQRGWHNRDKIKTPKGELWITVRVKKSPVDTPINGILLADTAIWKKDHLNLIKENYRKAVFFDEIFPHIENLYKLDFEKMADFNLASIKMLMGLFGIDIPCVMSSSMDLVGKKDELSINILRQRGAGVYLSGVGARDYLQPQNFEKAGIRLQWQDFRHPQYPQLHGEFIPYLSSIDLLFNCGSKISGEILRRC